MTRIPCIFFYSPRQPFQYNTSNVFNALYMQKHSYHLMSRDDTSKLLVIPPSQKDSIPDSGNFLLEGLKSLCKPLRIKEMTCSEKIGDENTSLILVYWFWKEENHQKLRKSIGRIYFQEPIKGRRESARGEGDNTLYSGGWGQMCEGAHCGRAGAIGQHKRLDSLGHALPFLWEKLWKGKKEGIRNCYVLS